MYWFYNGIRDKIIKYNNNYKRVCLILSCFLILSLGISSFLYFKLSEINDIKKVLSSYKQIAYEKEIELLKSKVEILTDANEMLKKRLHAMDVNFNDDINTTVSLMNKKKNEQKVALISQLDNMQMSDIIKTLKNYMSFDENIIPPGMNIRDFSRQLIKIAIGEEVETVDEPNHNPTDLKFRSNIDDNSSVYESTFDSNSSKIYGQFDTTNFHDGKVLVKWKRDNGELLYMDFYNVNKNNENNFIWMNRENGWKKGNYEVEIYSPSNQLKKMYSSSYQVK